MSSATGPYPTTKQFNEACLNPASAFGTGYLKSAKFRQFGPPLLRNFVLQGRFAAVSRAELTDGRTLGIRFLKSSQPGLLKRYQTLSRVFIRSNIEDNTVTVVLKPKELILPSGKWDLIEMEWVNGQTLSTEVKQLLEHGDIGSISALSEEFQKLAAKMASAEVSHGDISPENIMVNDGHLVLVDYDSFWSEELKSLPYNVGPSKLQHPKAPKNPGKLADRVAFSILKLGFSVLLNNPEKFASADGHLEQHRFVFDVDSLSKGDPSVGLIPESEKPLYELLMAVLSGDYIRVEELDRLLFPEIRLSNQWVTIRSITPRDLKIPEARTKIANAGIVVRRINNNDSISELDKEKAIRVLSPAQDSSKARDLSNNQEIIHLVAIANDYSISLRSLRPRLTQVGVQIYSSPTEHILVEHWNLVKDAVAGTDLTSDLKRLVHVSTDKPVEATKRQQQPAPADKKNHKIKVSELAKSLGMTNAEMLALCKANNVAAKTPQSTLVAAFIPMLKRKAEAAGLVQKLGLLSISPSVSPKKSADLVPPPPPNVVIADVANRSGNRPETVAKVARTLFGKQHQVSNTDRVKLWDACIIGDVRKWSDFPGPKVAKVSISGATTQSKLSGVLGCDWRQVRALGLLHEINYWPSNNTTIPEHEYSVLLEKLGISRKFTKNEQSHFDFARDIGLNPVRYGNVVRLLFPGDRQSLGSVDVVRAELALILPIDQWRNLKKFDGHSINIGGDYLTLHEVANGIQEDASFLRALLLTEGVVHIYSPENGNYPRSQMITWLKKIGLRIDGRYAKVSTSDEPVQVKVDFNNHNEYANSIGLDSIRYRNVLRLLFPETSESSLSIDAVRTMMISILPLDRWSHLRKYDNRQVELDESGCSLIFFAGQLGISPKVLQAVLLLEGVANVENRYQVYSRDEIGRMLTAIGFIIKERDVILDRAKQFGLTRLQYEVVSISFGLNRDISKVTPKELEVLHKFMNDIEVAKFSRTSVNGRYLLLDPKSLRFSVLANSLGISLHCLIVLLLVGGMKTSSAYWLEVVAHDPEFDGSLTPKISSALGVRIMLKNDESITGSGTKRDPSASLSSLHNDLARTLGVSLEKYFNMVRLLFPGFDPAMVSSESVKLKIDSIWPIHQWKNLGKFTYRTLKMSQDKFSIEDVAKEIQVSSSYLTALLVFEGVVYLQPYPNGIYLKDQMIKWLRQIGIEVSEPSFKPFFSEPSTHDAKNVASSLGLSKSEYLTIFRLLFPSQNLLTVTSESVKLKMDSILPLDQWRGLKKFSGCVVKMEKSAFSVEDIARKIQVSPSYVTALLVYKGVVSLEAVPNDAYQVDQMLNWLRQIGVFVSLPEMKKRRWWDRGEG